MLIAPVAMALAVLWVMSRFSLPLSVRGAAGLLIAIAPFALLHASGSCSVALVPNREGYAACSQGSGLGEGLQALGDHYLLGLTIILVIVWAWKLLRILTVKGI